MFRLPSPGPSARTRACQTSGEIGAFAESGAFHTEVRANGREDSTFGAVLELPRKQDDDRCSDDKYAQGGERKQPRT